MKRLRVFLALIFFTTTAALFLDLEGRAPEAVFETVLYLQPTPSLIKALGPAGWAAGGFALVLLLTLLLGRVFCSTVCPLGTLQDVVIRVAGRLRRNQKRVRFRYRRPQWLLRYGVLGTATISALSGSLALVAQLDPFGHFGRITGLLVRPLAIEASNLAVVVLERLDTYLLAPRELFLANWEVLALPLLVLAILVWMAARHGRLFCNTLCPVGTLLGLVSRVALFRIAIDQDQCNSCAQCSLQCKAECLHLKDHRVDFDRCVACLNCIPACPESGIGYRFAWKRGVESGERQEPSKIQRHSPLQSASGVEDASARGALPDPRSPARREFLIRSAGGVVAGLGVASVSVAEDPPKNKRPTKVPVAKEHPVAPPGAGSIARFNRNCIACQLCVSLCPTQVLQPSLFRYGLSGFLQPHMAYETAYCTYECARCGQVCPTDAIRSLGVEDKKLVRVGTAHFIEENCIVVTEKTACGACAEHCPTQAVHMVAYEGDITVPELDPGICVGCGACEHVCPVRPHRAIYVDGEPVHQLAEAPRSEALKVEIPVEFPF